MTNHRNDARRLYRSHQDILRKSEVLPKGTLTGHVRSMYAILDQCRVELCGREDGLIEGLNRWVYGITMPIMLLTDTRAGRGELHFCAALDTPFTEEKMRFGCQLHCDCDVFPICACELSPGVYRVTYDAHVSLYSVLLRAS